MTKASERNGESGWRGGGGGCQGVCGRCACGDVVSSASSGRGRVMCTEGRGWITQTKTKCV